MNAIDILSALDSLPEEYILEASARKAPERPHRPSLLLVAVLAAVMAMLARCAAYLLNLESLHIGTYHHTQAPYIDANGNRVPQQKKSQELMSLQGLAGSPNYLAAQEWNAFLENYETDLAPSDFGPEFDAYDVYTQEMADKARKIAEKYGLALAGERLLAEDWQESVFWDSLSLSGIARNGAGVYFCGGYFFACGSFSAELEVTVGNVPVPVTYRYNGKAYLDAMLTGVSSLEDCQEWTCPLPDGGKVLIAMDDEFVRVFRDREDAFLSLQFFRLNLDLDGNPVTLTMEDIQALISCLDFSVVPQKPDMNRAKDALRVSQKEPKDYESPFTRDYRSYADLIRTIWKNGAPQGYGYALRDITGDGEAELLLGVEGSFGTVKTLVEGKPVTLWSNGMVQGLELCQGDVLRWVSDNHVTFLKWNEATGQLETFLELGYDPWEKSWFRAENGVQKTISQAEYDSLLEVYPSENLDWKPLESYPME